MVRPSVGRDNPRASFIEWIVDRTGGHSTYSAIVHAIRSFRKSKTGKIDYHEENACRDKQLSEQSLF